jgi:hypothetical protein
VDKHFGESDEQHLARELVGKVVGRVEEKWVGVYERCREVGTLVYEGGIEEVNMLASREEVGRWFGSAR